MCAFLRQVVSSVCYASRPHQQLDADAAGAYDQSHHDEERPRTYGTDKAT